MPSDLCSAAVDEHLDARDVARVIGSEKRYRFGDLIGFTHAAERRRFAHLLAIRVDLLVGELELRLVGGRDHRAGETTLTRMSRPLRSDAHVLANERNAAFVAA